MSVTDNSQCCKTCRFHKAGFCHRYAPRAYLQDVYNEVEMEACWPEVEDWLWCGEYERNNVQ